MERTPAINLPPAVLWLAVAFIAVHVVRQFIGEADDEWVLLAFAFIPARYGAFGRSSFLAGRRRASGRR